MATERSVEDFWYVDDCSNCKDLDLFYEKDVPCLHPGIVIMRSQYGH